MRSRTQLAAILFCIVSPLHGGCGEATCPDCISPLLVLKITDKATGARLQDASVIVNGISDLFTDQYSINRKCQQADCTHVLYVLPPGSSARTLAVVVQLAGYDPATLDVVLESGRCGTTVEYRSVELARPGEGGSTSGRYVTSEPFGC